MALAALQARPVEDVSRREVARGLLGAFGLAALSGCASSAASEERPAPSLLGNTAQALSGTDVAWVDTVLGSGAANPRTGDLATRVGGGADLGTLVVAKGCVSPGDRGGGIFYWDPAGGTDDGGTVIVPSATAGAVGNSGPCWRRIFDGALSVRWFGTTSVPFDACDDAAIHRCVAAAVTLGGHTVFFPSGNYYLYAPIYLNSNGLKLIGESEYTTHIRRAWSGDATCIAIQGAASLCEVSDLHFTPQYYADGTFAPQTQGGVITFEDGSGGVTGVRLSRIFIEDAFRGIVMGSVRANSLQNSDYWSAHEVVIENVKMNRITRTGLYMRFALNCSITNMVIGMVSSPGAFGVWIDTAAEGCIFQSVFVLGGEHCWRFAHSHTGSPYTNDRAPSENRFYSCIGDTGDVTCFYASAGYRMIFDGCWASTQRPGATAAFSIDSSDVYGLVWTNGQMVNLKRHGFQINYGKLITISNSTFTSWGLAGTGYKAIAIQNSASYPATLSFSIIGNTFGTPGLADPNFPSGNTGVGVSIVAGTYYKYVVTGNTGLTLTTTLLDAGAPSGGKVVTNNI